MTLAEIASSKEICEELFNNGTLIDNLKNGIKNITPENEKAEIFNIVKIANRIVKFGEGYNEPDFDRGGAAADALELTFGLRDVDQVPFMNAAAYLLNAGEDERALKVCMTGNERFPKNLEILNKAKFAAELIEDTGSLEKIDRKKEELFNKNPALIADEMAILVNNWRIDEAKALLERYHSKDELPPPAALGKLFWIYNLSYKDEKTPVIAERYLEIIKAGNEEYIKNADLAYQSSLYFLNNTGWRDSDVVISAFEASGADLTALIINQILSIAIISKDKTKVEVSLNDFLPVYDKDKNFFDTVTYAFANVSNCYAMLGDKNKTLEYLNIAKSKQWDISYVKTMDDFKFIAADAGFLSLF